MKCEIIKDLIPLCSEGLCSEESRIAVEEHIKTCETCRLLYEKIPETEEKIQPPEEESAMKKLSRKFRANRLKTIVLAVLLLAVTGTIAVLTLNQFDRTAPCFSSVFQSIEARKLAKCIIKGDAEKYIGLTLDPAEYDLKTSAEGWEKIRKNEIAEFSSAYENILKGKDLHIDEISSDVYLSDNVYRTKLTSFYVNTKIILLADDLSAKYRIEIRKNGSDRWCVETVMDDYFNSFDGNPQALEVQKGLKMNIPAALPEGMYSDLVGFRSSGIMKWHFHENCRDRIAERIDDFFDRGFIFKDIKFSEIRYDSDRECFCYDMTVTAKDSKGLAVLDMPIYNKSGYQREWIPAPVSEQEIRTEGCTDELRNALSEMFG